MNSSDIICNSNRYNDNNTRRQSYNSLNHGSNMNDMLSIDEKAQSQSNDDILKSGLKYLPKWPSVNLEFNNLSCRVPDLENGYKDILRNVNGQFRSHELTAIIGPSGAGKTTLLNLLAGFHTPMTSGEITINNHQRNMRVFRKMSRYIMQNDILDPYFTVLESMILAANLKLGNELSKKQKLEVIDEILTTLRLQNSLNTRGLQLSGGERKRLCIALELVNNPPVLFLDEPTTGLDDTASTQCISLLRRIAHSGRTIICSVHTPSARIFKMFDKVYVLAEGQCIYQGNSDYIVPYMADIGLLCPITHNPADFIIEVACGEYGNEFHDAMVASVDNGRVHRWTPDQAAYVTTKSNITADDDNHQALDEFEEEINPKLLRAKSTWCMQYRILLMRMLVQIWRDKSYLVLKFCMITCMGALIGSTYKGTGEDATKALFNSSFALIIVIAFLYLPLMPVLLQFPSEMKLLKREHFNQWYHLSAYYAAMICSRIPNMVLTGTIFLSLIYFLSNQPLQLFRFAMILLISFVIGMTSDSFGLLIASRLSLVNAMFVGPTFSAIFLLLCTHGIGYGLNIAIPSFVRFLMNLSFLRHGMEGVFAALYKYNREDTHCPETEKFCYFKSAKILLITLGFDHVDYLSSISWLIGYYIFFTFTAYFMLRQRLLSSGRNNIVMQHILKYMTKYLNFSTYKY